MTSWSTSAFLVAIGIAMGPYGLNLLSLSVVRMLDPAIAMALAILGVFIGLAIDIPRVHLTLPVVLAVGGAVTALALRQSAVSVSVLALSTVALVGVAIAVAFAGWLLVGQTDSEREQQVFVVGSLLLVGGSAAYSSQSAVFAGVLAGIVWNAAGGLSKARIVKHLDYFQHPLVVVMLLSAGASVVFSVEALAVAIIVAALHTAGRPVVEPFSVSAGLAAIAVALDLYRGMLS
jgi:hypothetical protein